MLSVSVWCQCPCVFRVYSPAGLGPRTPGADDRDRTGDLVLTKDALCQLSYIGLRAIGASADKSANLVWRSLERETGIEPATNSLEGCDSTTELLPPSRLARVAFRRVGGQARFSSRPTSVSPSTPFGRSGHSTRQRRGLPRASRSPASRVVAREGFEPSKPLGRQIYSLLRLTASLPRRDRPAVSGQSTLRR